MSQKETTDTIGRLEASESHNADLSELAELARQAFEQKRTKDCLDLTRAMLLIDPDNADARSMRLSIQSEMHRDLDNARAFLRQAQSKENPESQLHLTAEDGIPQLLRLVPDSVPLPAAAGIFRRSKAVRWSLGASAFIVAGLIVAALPKFRTNTNPVEPSLLALGAPDIPRPVVSEVTRPAKAETPAVLVPAPPSVPSTIAARVPSPELQPAAALPDRPAVTGTGILAIGSPTSVDIYEDDAYLGSVPVSLELSAGAHTLEYRHGSLRKIVSHVINRDETAKTTITFDVSVQINSRPWAEVFVDGVEKKDLGQTPLSGVRVPIGAVLIFENPQFQAKRYRITGNETGIQVVFP
jgi:hypothetical protein